LLVCPSLEQLSGERIRHPAISNSSAASFASHNRPYSPANQVYLVSHVGLNGERWWNDFTSFDKDDQEFLRDYLQDSDAQEVLESGEHPRMTLRPFMRVLR
jgi:hypothetical protein